jgi:hypothetical protein
MSWDALMTKVRAHTVTARRCHITHVICVLALAVMQRCHIGDHDPSLTARRRFLPCFPLFTPACCSSTPWVVHRGLLLNRLCSSKAFFLHWMRKSTSTVSRLLTHASRESSSVSGVLQYFKYLRSGWPNGSNPKRMQTSGGEL